MLFLHYTSSFLKAICLKDQGFSTGDHLARPPAGIWQWVETFLILIAWQGVGCYRHLAGKGQGCFQTSYNTHDSSPSNKGLSHQNVNSAEIIYDPLRLRHA